MVQFMVQFINFKINHINLLSIHYFNSIIINSIIQVLNSNFVIIIFIQNHFLTIV